MHLPATLEIQRINTETQGTNKTVIFTATISTMEHCKQYEFVKKKGAKMVWQHKIKKDILTGLYGNQPCWFLPSKAFSSKLIHIQQNKQHIHEFSELPLKRKHLFPRVCLQELCKILNTMCFHCNPIFGSHPVNFPLNQCVYLRQACVHFLERQCSHRFRHRVCGSWTNAFQCNSANFPQQVFWFSGEYKVSYNCKCMWLWGKAGTVLPGLSGDTTTAAFVNPWYPTCALGACSTAILEARAWGRLSAPIQTYWPGIWILARSLVDVFEQ